MTSRKNRLIAWGIYSLGTYIILLTFGFWFFGIPISIIMGFLFGLLNEIILQLRKLNGEKDLFDEAH